MSAIQTKVDICKIALGDLGIRSTIENIDTPKKDNEIICALYYDITRQYTLKSNMPNFALWRDVMSAKTVPLGYVKSYAYAYEYPVDCLKLLGVGDIDMMDDNCNSAKPTVEGGLIFTNVNYTDGMPIRYVRDITDVSLMTPDFIFTLAKEIGKRISLPVTQDKDKKKIITQEAKDEQLNMGALNAQENKPIRRSVSRIRAARNNYISMNPVKP